MILIICVFNNKSLCFDFHRRVYLAYLDSVQYFEPSSCRTALYHEILLAYMQYIKNLGLLNFTGMDVIFLLGKLFSPILNVLDMCPFTFGHALLVKEMIISSTVILLNKRFQKPKDCRNGTRNFWKKLQLKILLQILLYVFKISLRHL